MPEQSQPEFTPSQFRNDIGLYINRRFGRRKNKHEINLQFKTLAQLKPAVDKQDRDAAHALSVRVERLSSWYKFVKGADAPIPTQDELIAFEAENLVGAEAPLTEAEGKTMAEVTRAVDRFTPFRALIPGLSSPAQKTTPPPEL